MSMDSCEVFLYSDYQEKIAFTKYFDNKIKLSDKQIAMIPEDWIEKEKKEIPFPTEDETMICWLNVDEALRRASRENRKKIVKMLIDAVGSRLNVSKALYEVVIANKVRMTNFFLKCCNQEVLDDREIGYILRKASKHHCSWTINVLLKSGRVENGAIEPALENAVDKGQYEVARLLLNTQHFDKSSLSKKLEKAAENGDDKMSKLLLKHMGESTESIMPSLKIAVLLGNEKVERVLVKSGKITPEETGLELRRAACEGGSGKLAKHLLSYGPKLDHKQLCQYLRMAVEAGNDHIDVAQAIVDCHQLSPQEIAYALRGVIYSSDVKTIKFLRNNRINFGTLNQYYPLYFAVQKNKISIVEMLFEVCSFESDVIEEMLAEQKSFGCEEDHREMINLLSNYLLSVA